MQPCNHATCSARTGRPGVAALILPATRLAGVKKSFSFFFAMKYTGIPQERKKEHAHDEKIRENGAIMVRITTWLTTRLTTWLRNKIPKRGLWPMAAGPLCHGFTPHVANVSHGAFFFDFFVFFCDNSWCNLFFFERISPARWRPPDGGPPAWPARNVMVQLAFYLLIKIESGGLTCGISRLQCTRKCNLATCSARTSRPGVAALILPAKRLAGVKNRFPFFRDETHNTL